MSFSHASDVAAAGVGSLLSPAGWQVGEDVQIEDVVLERVDKDKLVSEDDARQHSNISFLRGNGTQDDGDIRLENNLKHPFRWGVSPEVSVFPGISMRYNGNWTQLNDREWIWRLRITSPEATSQQLIFSTLWLPAGSQMWLYSEESHEKQECDADCYAFTASDTRIDEKFTTPIIHGSRIYLEYHIKLPENPVDTIVPRIHIFKVVQGYRDILREKSSDANQNQNLDLIRPKGMYGVSESCNNDATCPLLGDDWDKARHSVVQIITDGGSSGSQFSAVCTGTLIDNVDKRNYVLTAYHCLEGESVSNWAFVFNYERPCDRQEVHRSKFKDFLNGARLVWADKSTDVILLEIYQDIPSHYNAYFAGWDANTYDLLDPFSVSFHHPSGDFKKVSVDSHAKGLTGCPFCGDLKKSHIVVTGWDDGTTEEGSSGCSLLSSDMNVVGVLSGGSASCPDNSGFDIFGKLELAYDHGLKDYLNRGQRSMEGRWNVDPNAALEFHPQTFVVVENAPQASFEVRLSEPVTRGDVARVSISLPEEASQWVEWIQPREIEFRSEDWHRQRLITIKPRDNADFHGDIRYYVRLSVQYDSGYASYTSDYPIIHQDDEHLAGDTLFDPISIGSLPFTFMGNTHTGYTNTLQSRCELGSASPDVVFEYTPDTDMYVTMSLCSMSLFDSVMYVLENGRELWCNDDGEMSAQCGMSAELNNVLFYGGRTYQIVVDGYDGGKGKFELRMYEGHPRVDSFSGPPPSDTFHTSGNTYHAPTDTYAEKSKEEDSDRDPLGSLLNEGLGPLSLQNMNFFNVLGASNTATVVQDKEKQWRSSRAEQEDKQSNKHARKAEKSSKTDQASLKSTSSSSRTHASRYTGCVSALVGWLAFVILA